MLTQLATLKARLGIEPFDPTDDTLLTNLLTLCQGRFELETNRKFQRTEDATFEFSADKTEILPERYPIESVSSFELKSTETDGWILQSAVAYLLRRNHVISIEAALGSERELARVTYTGGFVLPGTDPEVGQVALPPELEQACVEQTVHWYQNRARLGLSSVSGPGGSVLQNPLSVAKPLDLLPLVMPVLKRYERYVL